MDTPNDARPQNTRRKFAAMVGVYFVGTLNDNFCRQCVMLLAVAWGLARMQSYITVLFTVPSRRTRRSRNGDAVATS